MFSGFNLKLNESFFTGKPKDFYFYRTNGENHLKYESDRIKKNLELFIKNDSINGSKLQNEWFPKIKADVFISHSHQDCDLANALAGWINEEFGLKVFIDSNIWGHSNKLLKNINSKYSNMRVNPLGGYLYDYSSCCAASQHVNMMLSVALQQMIDNTECIILLNTNNSVNVFDNNNDKINTTYSPWIYSEIICSEIIRKKPLWYYRNYHSLKNMHEDATPRNLFYSLLISYDVNLEHLIEIEQEKLDQWLETYINKKDKYKFYPLDALYTFTYPDDLNNAKEMFYTYGYQGVDLIKQMILENRNIINQSVFYENFECTDFCEEFHTNCGCCNGKDCICHFLKKRRNNTNE